MRRFKNILYVADANNRGRTAFDRAADFARDNQARLTIVDVVERSQRDDVLLGFAQANAVRQAAVELRASQLAEMTAPLLDRGIKADTTVLTGTPFYEIVRKVLRDGHDLLVKDAHFARRSARVPFDPIELHLMRKCPCPVWIEKPRRTKGFRKIMAAVDTDPAAEKDNELNIRIMDLASTIASWDGSELHVVHAWDLYSEDLLSSALGFRGRELERTFKDAEMICATRLEALVSPYRRTDLPLSVHLLKGHPVEILPRFSRGAGFDLIVMGTLARTGFAGIFIGNTAEAVIDQVDCSYLTIKPDDFECPIKA